MANCSFARLGESALAAWGYTEAGPREAAALPAGVGIDGTRGEQPRGTTFAGNLVRDLGINERQSSAFGEFKACLSTVERNVIFNIPRAAVNINDGFGGGTRITRNLLFNTCRESGDHGGPIASLRALGPPSGSTGLTPPPRGRRRAVQLVGPAAVPDKGRQRHGELRPGV